MTASSDTPRSGSQDDFKSTSHDDLPRPTSTDEKTAQDVAADTPTLANSADDGYLSLKKLLPVFASIYLTLFLIALDRTIIATAIPTITNDFNSLGDLEWYASAYMLTNSAFVLVYGRLYSFYSPKYLFISSIVIFEVGSAICGAAPNSKAFIVGRAVAGLGGAGAFSGAIVLMMYTIPLHKRPMYGGFLGSAFGISSVMGPLMGGAFTSSSATWRWCFYINLPIGGVALVIVALILPNIKPAGAQKKTLKEQWQSLDPVGTLLFLPSMTCLILALQWGGSSYSWNDGRIIALLTVFAVTLLAFLGDQIWKGETATVPPRIVKMRSVAAATWFSFCNASAMISIVYFLPVWFQAIQGVSAVESGIRTIPIVLSLVLFSILSGIAVRHIGYYVPFMLASCVIQSIGCGLLTTLRVDSSEGEWIGYQVLYGAGLGMGMQQASLSVQTVLEKKDIAVGASLVFFAQQLGGAIWVAVAQNLFDQKLVSGLSQLAGFDPSAIVGGGATNLRNLVPVDKLAQVLEVYNGALVVCFKAGLGIACAGILGALATEWKSTKRDLKAKKKGQEASKA